MKRIQSFSMCSTVSFLSPLKILKLAIGCRLQVSHGLFDKTPLGCYYLDMSKEAFQTVVETPEFVKQAGSCMDKSSRDEFVSYIAANPLAGDLMVGTGGARKIRWASSQHQGKRGGARVIYYYYDRSMPIFLFTAYGKSEKANLSQAECGTLKVIIKQIVSLYKGDKNE